MLTVDDLSGPLVPPAAGGKPSSIVVLVHGYGSNGQDLIGLVPYWRDALPHTLFVAPNAPESCPGAPGGYQWWSLANRSDMERASGVRRPAASLNRFLDAELERHGLTDDRLALVGFSQGTMLALHVGPRRARPPAGIVGYSGMLVDGESLAAEVRGKPPILLVHGDADPTVPVAALADAVAVLAPQGFPLTTHVSPGLGHGVDEAGLVLGRRFLADVLA